MSTTKDAHMRINGRDSLPIEQIGLPSSKKEAHALVRISQVVISSTLLLRGLSFVLLSLWRVVISYTLWFC